MDTRAPLRSGWVPLAVTLLARMLLGVLASLLLWALAPAALGWHPTVVMTGSMLPRLVPGDVVLSRPVPAADLQLGQTLLFRDPDHAGHLRLHRWVAVAPGGRLVTRGDANPADDSTPVARSAVVGVGSLRVPFVARPVVWAADGRTAPLVGTGLALVLVLLAACWFRAADSGGPATDDDVASRDPGPGDAEPVVATSAWPRRLARSGVSLLVVLGLGAAHATLAGAVAAPFARTTTTPTDTWASATYFSCAAAARAAGADVSWPLGEAAGPTAASGVANGPTGTYSGGVTYGAAGPCRPDATTGVTLNGSSGAVSGSTAVRNPAQLSMQVWFRTGTTQGGTLVSVTSTFLFVFDSTSAAIGMNPGGTLTFGVSATFGYQRTTGPAAYNDNRWHLATGVVGADGMTLYVDGARVAGTTALTSAAAVSGTPRVGYGVGASLLTSTANYFQGTVAFASFYDTALPAAVVQDQYRVAAG